MRSSHMKIGKLVLTMLHCCVSRRGVVFDEVSTVK